MQRVYSADLAEKAKRRHKRCSAPFNEHLGEGPVRDKPRVLIVEDDYFASMEMEASLTEAGLDVVGVANSAEEAVNYAKTERPDLMVMDIRLTGGRDGVDAAVEIRKATGIRCLFATAHHDASCRERAKLAVPLGWLPKPYTQEALVAAVKRALQDLKS